MLDDSILGHTCEVEGSSAGVKYEAIPQGEVDFNQNPAAYAA